MEKAFVAITSRLLELKVTLSLSSGNYKSQQYIYIVVLDKQLNILQVWLSVCCCILCINCLLQILGTNVVICLEARQVISLENQWEY